MAYASVLGLGVMVLVASIVLLCALGAAWWLVGLLGNEVYKRLRRTYHLTVIGYWLGRLEKGGMREFQKAEEYDEALKRKGATRAALTQPTPVQQTGTVEAARWIEQALPFVSSPSWSSSHYVAGKTILAALTDSPTACDVPPAGWRCTRARGHEGPCAAIAEATGVAAP